MLGDSILFAKSDILWQQKRKALSAALYKDKLRVMMEIMKEKTISIIRNKWMKANNGEINIVREAANLFINITSSCLFGSGNEAILVP
jgi:cytochrome P450